MGVFPKKQKFCLWSCLIDLNKKLRKCQFYKQESEGDFLREQKDYRYCLELKGLLNSKDFIEIEGALKALNV